MFRLNKTQKITGNVFVVKTLISNFFIYCDRNTNICFDAGFMPFIINRELKKININPDSISSVFLTHTDFRYIGGIKLFRNARIHLSRDISSKKSEKLISYLNRYKNTSYRKLKDGEVTNIGRVKIKSFVIPDHDPGSMSYIVNDRVLFI